MSLLIEKKEKEGKREERKERKERKKGEERKKGSGLRILSCNTNIFQEGSH